MFERFTDRARRAVVLAQEEARMLNHNYIGTEHLLLGLIREGDGDAAKALEDLGVSHEAVRTQVEELIGLGKEPPHDDHVPFTPRAKVALELSMREALQLGQNYIGTEHTLLGVIREGEGIGAQVLATLGADRNRVRHEVIRRQSADAQLAYEGRKPPDEELMEPAPSTPSEEIQEIRALLGEVVDRLNRIERHLIEGDDTP